MFISFSNLHRKKELWGESANEFYPENFNEENSAKRHPYAYLPFSLGPRNCVGAKYANTGVRIMLIYLIKNFKFSTKLKLEELKFNAGISLIVKNRHIVSMEKRREG